MKPGILSITAGLLVFVFYACSGKGNVKDTHKAEEKAQILSVDAPLSGTTSWKEVGYFYSIGGPDIQWHYPAADSAEIIRLESNRVFYSSQRPELNRYSLDTTEKPSLLKVYKEGTADTLRWHLKQLAGDTIEISFVCVEACGKKFARYSK